MDKYFKVSIFFFSLKATFSSYKKKRKMWFYHYAFDWLCYVICCIIGFNHVRQIQNKSKLKIFKMMNT